MCNQTEAYKEMCEEMRDQTERLHRLRDEVTPIAGSVPKRDIASNSPKRAKKIKKLEKKLRKLKAKDGK
jgi:hypothetical protein